MEEDLDIIFYGRVVKEQILLEDVTQLFIQFK